MKNDLVETRDINGDKVTHFSVENLIILFLNSINSILNYSTCAALLQ